MKTLIKNDTKTSLYLFEDSEAVDIQEDKVVIGNPARLIIDDLDSSNASLIEGVTEPTEWVGYKYFYDDGWVSNSNYATFMLD